MTKNNIRKGLVCILGYALAFSLFSVNSSGQIQKTEKGEYAISTSSDLLYFSKNYGDESCPLEATYVLSADIDMSEVPNYIPPKNDFLGRFDGRGHVIDNLTIRCPDDATLGFFRSIGNNSIQAVVCNLALRNVYVLGRNTVGALAGALCGTIENCYVNGEVHVMMHCAGGIAGRLPEIKKQSVKPLMKDCFCAAALICEGEADSQGGLVGRILSDGGSVETSVATGEVYGHNKTGGITGQLLKCASLRKCAALNSLLISSHSEGLTNPVAGQVQNGAVFADNLSWEEFAGGREAFTEKGWSFDGPWLWSEAAGGPVLKTFPTLDYSYRRLEEDETWVPKAVCSSASDRIEIGFEGPEGMQYCVSDASRGVPGVAEWSSSKQFVFDKLSPATPYSFCYCVKDARGLQSRWYRITINTKWVASDDKHPFNVMCDVSRNPSESMNISWTTLDTTLVNSTVWLAAKSDFSDAELYYGLNRVAEVRNTINKKLYDGVRNFHYVTLKGLQPGTRYYYKVGDIQCPLQSEVRSFRTSPLKTKAMEFAYVADLQVDKEKSVKVVEKNFENVLQRMPDPDFVYFAGDMTENGYNYSQWDRFFRACDPILTSRFSVPVQGNHDNEFDLQNNFCSPSSLGNIPFVYSFDYGCAHFIVLNTQFWKADDIAGQIEWMKEDLENNRSRWNIVMLHKALYAATDHVDDEDINYLRSTLVPVIEEYKIDAVLMGHDHSFTRSFVDKGFNAAVPFRQKGDVFEYRKPSAPLYIVNGTGGISKWYYKIKYDASKLTRVSPDYEFVDKTSANFNDSIKESSFSLVRIDNHTLKLETWFFKCGDSEESGYVTPPYLFDSVIIRK